MHKSIFVFCCLAALTACSRKEFIVETALQPTETIGDVVLNQIALDLKDNLSAEEIAQLGKDYGIIIRDNSPESHSLGNIEVANVASNQEAALITKLSNDPRVEIVEPVMMAHALFTPNDPMFDQQWGMTKVGFSSSMNYTCGQSVVVAVVDTGITSEDKNGFKVLSDLKDNAFVPGYNFVDAKNMPADDQGHGSHCAGTIAQNTNNSHGAVGLAPCVHLLGIKVLNSQGSGSMENVAEGIRWAADHNANVISLSLGSSSNSAIVAKAVAYAHDKGVFLSCAAGNSGGSVGFPAANPGCVAVSASDQKDELASFSSRGKEVAIAAPGVGILQQTITEGGKGSGSFEKMSGTSMSCPSVSAEAALLFSQGITDPDKILQTMQVSAIQKTDHNKFGAGIMNAGDATSGTWRNHILLRSLFLALLTFVLATILRKNKLTAVSGTTRLIAIGAAVFSSVGLFCFLPFFGVLPHLGSLRVVGDLLSRPFSEWDLAYSVGLHKWLPLASALPTFILVSLGYHNRVVRALAGGLAIGTAAYCLQVAWSNEVAFVAGQTMMRVWVLLNALIMMWVAKNTLVVVKK